MYRIELVLASDVPRGVLEVLQYMLSGPRAQLNIAIETPNHPLFGTPGWMRMFYHCAASSLKLRAGGTYRLAVRGESDSEEQDFGLFLRWLAPYIRDSNRPRRIAVVRNKARKQLACLNYFICQGKIGTEFVDQPLLSINNFYVRAAA